MQAMYQQYKDVAEFYIVYIREAHAMDGRRPVRYAEDLGIKEPTTFGERCAVAGRLAKDKKLTIPCVIDGMDNAAEMAYRAWPDRVYLVRTDGKLAVAGRSGPWGFDPALQQAGDWLAEFKETGKELERVKLRDRRTPDLAAMERESTRRVSGVADPDKEEKNTVDSKASKPRYRGLLGKSNTKIKVDGGKTYVWASGDPNGPGAEWYDFTGAPMPPGELQFGIGRDRIASIDDPLFVAPDDPRLMELPTSRYRREERPKNSDDIMVIGFAHGDDFRAYPAALLDHHELVNDIVGGKPVTVGW